MRLTPENYSIADLIRYVDEGTLALPEFQRKFIWQPAQIADLLRTFARKWPAGTFLLLAVDGDPDFAVKEIASAPPITKPQLLLLDGQQRTTALYQALSNKAPEVYFIRIGDVATAGDFEDDHLEYMKASKFSKIYPSMKEYADDRVVPVDVLLSDAAWQKWLRYIPDEAEQDKLVSARSTYLPGFKEYAIPAVRMPDDVPLAAIAKIFETLNKTGTRLATFDLMVARLYPSEFFLRDRWIEARHNYPDLQVFGLDDDKDGVEILKIIALKENLRQKKAGVRITVRGIRESDVLALAPDTVIAHWESATSAYAKAIEFLKDKCGVIRPNMLPSQTVVIPIAYILGELGGNTMRAGMRDDLARWFWATSFGQTYSQGANTRAVSDARDLSAWNESDSAVPPVITNFRLESGILKDGRRRNEMLLRGLMCLSALNNAKDWITGKRFVDIAETQGLEFHHVFPDEYMQKHWTGDPDPIAVFSLLQASTNASLRNTNPADVLARGDVNRTSIESNVINVANFENRDGVPIERHIERFINDRAQTLESRCYEAVGVPRPVEG